MIRNPLDLAVGLLVFGALGVGGAWLLISWLECAAC